MWPEYQKILYSDNGHGMVTRTLEVWCLVDSGNYLSDIQGQDSPTLKLYYLSL